ncbi:MAG: right-handed parallel beta-helix repeat-containing protein [Bacteroidales bacterium]
MKNLKWIVLLGLLNGLNVLEILAAPKYIIGIQASYINFQSGILPNGKIYNIAPNRDTIWPGDTIGIAAGERTTYLRIKNLRGTPAQPIILINYGGRVIISNTASGGALALKTCRNVILSGSGHPAWEYGIKLDTTAAGNNGLSLDELTSDIEVHHLEICRQGFAGIMAKTDPSCNPSTWRENFTLNNLHIHHCYIHHTQGEGMYIGYSVYGPVTRSCGGSTIQVYAHEVKHLRVHDNIVEWTGLDGIQISCATEDVLVFNNSISRTGFLDNTYSKGYGMEGICVGGGSTGRYFNNIIADTYGSGFNVFGVGEVYIFNNVILRPGRPSKFAWNQHFVYGIFADDRTTIPGSSFYYINNTIVSPRTSGIKIASTQSRKNRVYNNVILDPATKHLFGNYGNNWMQSCLQIGSGVSALVSSNYFDTVRYSSYYGLSGSTDPYFIAAVQGNFRLKDSTNLVDNALAADTVASFSFDADSLPRPGGSAWDIGAYEYHPPIEPGEVGWIPVEKSSKSKLMGIPKHAEWKIMPRSNELEVIPPIQDSFYQLWIYDMQGRFLGAWEKLIGFSYVPLPLGSQKSVLLIVAEQEGKKTTHRVCML